MKSCLKSHVHILSANEQAGNFVGNVISLASDERKKHFLGKTYNFDFHIADTQKLESQLLSVLEVSHWPL